MEFYFKRGYNVYCDDPHDYPNFYIFTSLKAIKEYYNLSASELATWRDEGECPDRDELSQIDDCTIVTLVEKKATKEITSLKEIYSFRTSEDGDHWDRCVGGFFSSMDQLVQYVEALLIDKGFMSDEDINNTCRTLKKDLYSKWVNPDDKKDKYYIKVDTTILDIPYSE